MFLGGFALLVWGYVSRYQQLLEELRKPGVMYCGFMPFGVVSDLFWMEAYHPFLIGSAVLVLGGIVLRWIFRRTDDQAVITENAE